MPSDVITVKFSYLELSRKTHHFMTPYILYKLRNAGIPVQGVLLFDGVHTGKLVQIDDFENKQYIFKYYKTEEE